MRGAWLTALAVCGLAASAALAADAPPPAIPVPPPSAAAPPGMDRDPAKVAQARSDGDAMLAQSGLGDAFANQSGSNGFAVIVLKHKASAISCRFLPGQAANALKPATTVAMGDAVCVEGSAAGPVQVSIVRAGGRTNAQLLAEAAAQVKQDYPNAAAADPTTIAATATSPEHLNQLFLAGQNAVDLVVGNLGDWALEYRAVTPAGQVNPQVNNQEWAGMVADRNAPVANIPLTLPQAKAVADQVISGSDVKDLFVNDTINGLPAVKIKGSGFVCALDAPAGAGDRLVVPPNTPAPRGDDVECLTHPAGISVGVFATRSTDSLQQAYANEITAIRTVHPDATPYTGVVARVNAPAGKTIPDHMTVRITYTQNGALVFERISVAVMGGWRFEQHLAAPAANASTIPAADLLGESIFALELQRTAAERTTTPTA